MAESKNDRRQALELAITQIERQFGKGSVMRLGASGPLEEIAVIPTGALSLDAALGIGGLPRGRVVEIYGPESSGKTTLALHVIAEAQQLGGIAAFIDAEHALDPIYARKLGVNIDELLISQPDTGEQALEITETLVRSNAVDVIVIDSVAALVPRAASCPRPCASSPPQSPAPAPSSSSSTRSARRSASCSDRQKRPPAAAR
jgi:recombination protein RecA